MPAAGLMARRRRTGTVRVPDGRRCERAMQLVVVLPLLWYLVQLAGHHWMPQGDEAIIGIHTRDVFSVNPPLEGQRADTSFSDPGLYAHHPGPLQYYLLAVPYALTGWHPVGLVFGSLLIVAGCAVLAIRSARQAGGLAAATAVFFAILFVEGANRSFLVHPWNTFPPMLGLLVTMMLAWRLMLGQLWAMPWFALTASMTAQAHLLQLPIVGLLTILLSVVGVTRWYRSRDAIWPMPGYVPHRLRRRPRRTRPGWVTTAVALVVWAPVIADAVIYFPGNTVKLIQFGFRDNPHLSLGSALGRTVQLMVPTGHVDAFHLGSASVLQWTAAAGVAAAAGWVCTGYLTVWKSQIDSRRAGRRVQELTRAQRHHRAAAAGIAVTALCTAALTVTTSHVTGGLQLWYSDIGIAAPVGLTCLAIWGAGARLRALRPTASAGPPRKFLVPVAALAAVAIFSAAPRNSLVSGTAEWSQHERFARTVTASVDRELDRRGVDHAPILIRAAYGTVQGSLAPALELHLLSRGHDVYFPRLWPEGESSFRHDPDRAPATAVRIWVRQRTASGLWSIGDIPPGATMLTFPGSSAISGSPQGIQVFIMS
ncbi:MAG: hypothetical protein M3Y49_17535 [Actinomycetota bacterium]|nr:hypothetical protein [Actinomycetota bacterium]